MAKNGWLCAIVNGIRSGTGGCRGVCPRVLQQDLTAPNELRRRLSGPTPSVDRMRSMSMASPDTLRYTRIPLTHGSGAIPAVGFGTLIPDPLATEQATKTALEVGFRHLDCAERYRNEEAVGDAMQAVFRAGTIRREDVFVTTK